VQDEAFHKRSISVWELETLEEQYERSGSFFFFFSFFLFVLFFLFSLSFVFLHTHAHAHTRITGSFVDDDAGEERNPFHLSPDFFFDEKKTSSRLN
jgi:hypothetical protein